MLIGSVIERFQSVYGYVSTDDCSVEFSEHVGVIWAFLMDDEGAGPSPGVLVTFLPFEPRFMSQYPHPNFEIRK